MWCMGNEWMMGIAGAVTFVVVVTLASGIVRGEDNPHDVWNLKNWPSPQSPYPVGIYVHFLSFPPLLIL